MYDKGEFRPFDSILNALLYPGLGWGINKIRFGLVGLYLRLTITGSRWKRHRGCLDAGVAGNRSMESMWSR